MGNKTGDLIFTLIMVALLCGTAACSDGSGGTTDTDTTDTDSLDTSVQDSDFDSDSDTASDTINDSDTDFPSCPSYSQMESMEVTGLPGIAADLQDICISAAIPVHASSDAVLLTLTPGIDGLRSAQGTIQFAEGLSPFVVGDPVLAIDTASQPELMDGVISNLQPTDGGFTFDISFPNISNSSETLPVQPFGGIFIHLSITFSVDCAGLGTDIGLSVQSVVPMYFCGTDESTYNWMGPGEECTLCAPIINEVSAIPVPSRTNNEGVLSGPMEAQLLPVGETAEMILLLADCNSTRNPVYRWRASRGHLLQQEGPLAVYVKTGIPGSTLVQVAATDDINAGIATYHITES